MRAGTTLEPSSPSKKGDICPSSARENDQRLSVLGRSIQSWYLSGRRNGADFVLCRNASGTRLFMSPSLLRRRLGDARHQNERRRPRALRSRCPFTYFLNQNKKRRVYIPSGTRGIGSRVPASSSKCTSQTGSSSRLCESCKNS